MAKTFRLDIVTPEKTVFSEDVVSLVVPAEEGYYGVLAGHAPFLCTLKAGEILIRREKGEIHYATSGGFMEVTPQKTIILSETAEDVRSIDMKRAEEALEKAKERLTGASGADRESAQADLERAANRLRLGSKYRK